ncbi:MAG: hypothetical protein JWM95_509 [Gemmatimonadetes bacterium]|nr:hypothetical protein [Gemmatimonadota bacterium]
MSDRILRTALGAVLLIGVIAGCSENVTSTLGCPTLCVDESAALRDTVLNGSVVLDSSLFGYPQLGDTRDITLLNQGDSADVRVVARYDSLPLRYQISGASSDSLIRKVDSATMIFVIDTLTTRVTSAITIEAFNVDTVANDTALKAVLPLFRAGRLLGSQTFNPGDLKDTVRLQLNNDSLFAKIRDTLHLRVGLRIRGDGSRKLRVLGTLFAPRIRIKVYSDTTVPPDTLYPNTLAPANNAYLQGALSFYRVVAKGDLSYPPPGTFVIGGVAGARTFLKFDIPQTVIDSVTVIRASLILQQTRGRSTARTSDSLSIFTHPVLASPQVTDVSTLMNFIGSSAVYGVDSLRFAPSDSGQRSVELVNLFRTWKVVGATNTIRSIVLRTPLESASAGELSFFSMEGPVALRPKLRITYVPRRGFGIP